MDTKPFLTHAISLLKKIEDSCELKNWCQRYSINDESRSNNCLEGELYDFVEQAYCEGVVIAN